MTAPFSSTSSPPARSPAHLIFLFKARVEELAALAEQLDSKPLTAGHTSRLRALTERLGGVLWPGEADQPEEQIEGPPAGAAPAKAAAADPEDERAQLHALSGRVTALERGLISRRGTSTALGVEGARGVVLHECHIPAKAPGAQFSYSALAGPYCAGVTAVTLREPYLEKPHQLANLEEFLDAVVQGSAGQLRSIRIITGEGSRVQAPRFEQVAEKAAAAGHQFEVSYVKGEHDREILLSNGVAIVSDRGIDLYERPPKRGGRAARVTKRAHIVYYSRGHRPGARELPITSTPPSGPSTPRSLASESSQGIWNPRSERWHGRNGRFVTRRTPRKRPPPATGSLEGRLGSVRRAADPSPARIWADRSERTTAVIAIQRAARERQGQRILVEEARERWKQDFSASRPRQDSPGKNCSDLVRRVWPPYLGAYHARGEIGAARTLDELRTAQASFLERLDRAESRVLAVPRVERRAIRVRSVRAAAAARCIQRAYRERNARAAAAARRIQRAYRECYEVWKFERQARWGDFDSDGDMFAYYDAVFHSEGAFRRRAFRAWGEACGWKWGSDGDASDAEGASVQ